MKYAAPSELFVLGLLILGQPAQQQCGQKVANGAVMCAVTTEDQMYRPFDFKLCTHAILAVSVGCYSGKNACKLKNPEKIKQAVKWASADLPNSVGLYFPMNKSVKDWLLGDPKRRSNTINELVQFMADTGIVFVEMTGASQSLVGSSVVDRAHYFDFVQELTEKLHDRGFYYGQDIHISGADLIFNYNVGKMSTIVDYYSMPPLQALLRGYMESYTPLETSFGKAEGSTKYWIEKALDAKIKPDCMVIDIGPRVKVQTAIEYAVEPGLGSGTSRKSLVLATDVSTVCSRLYFEDHCREFWDDETRTPYAVCGNTYYSYDNARSLRIKADFLKQYNISGICLLGEDITPKNLCGRGDPLVIYKAVQGFRKTASSTTY